MAKRFQVVLKEDVSTLGKRGDVVDVAPGFARNFLVPQGKALPVTAAVLKQVEHHRAKEAERREALLQEALAFRTALATIGALKIRKHTGSDGVLFGTVTNGDVAEAITEPPGKMWSAATSKCRKSIALGTTPPCCVSRAALPPR